MRTLLAVLVTAASLLAVAGCETRDGRTEGGGAPPARRLIVLSLDGLGWELAQQKMAEGKMPNLAALAARGATAAGGSVTCYPAKTAPGHATLWTGCWADRHRILDNDTPALPRGRHTILEVRRGFDAEALGSDPVWRVAAREGRRVTVVQATQAEPDAEEDRGLDGLSIFNGYRGLVKPALITGGAFAADGKNFVVEREGDGVAVSCPPVRVHVPPKTWTAVDHPGVSGVFYLYVARLESDGWAILRSSYSTVAAPTAADAGQFRREVGGYAYNAQKLEPTLNDGTPWKREAYLAAARLNAGQVKKAVLWALRNHPAELTIAYLPQPDEVLHEMLGRAELLEDAAARALIDDVLAICDGLVGDLAAAAGPDGALAVVSDHGMAPVDRIFYPNLALERAGLLARNGRGDVNLAATQVIFSPGGDFLEVNTIDHRAGVVKPEEKEGFLSLAERTVAKAGEAALGPGTILPPLRPGTPGELPVSPEGDSWISAACDGVRLCTQFSPDLPPPKSPLVREIEPVGYHSGDPRIPRMRATMVFAGSGFRHAEAAGVRGVDFAPTVLAWLGLETPSDMAGKPLQDLLEPR